MFTLIESGKKIISIGVLLEPPIFQSTKNTIVFLKIISIGVLLETPMFKVKNTIVFLKIISIAVLLETPYFKVQKCNRIF